MYIMYNSVLIIFYVNIYIFDCQHVYYIIILLYLVLLLVLYCSCRTLRTSPKSEPCTFGFPSVGSSAFASCSLEHPDHIVVFPYHSRVHHHLCCSRTFFFKSWEVSKFRFFRHIFMLTCLSDIRYLSLSRLYTLIFEIHSNVYLIPYPFLTTTHTHTKRKEKLPCTADNIWNAATPACAEGQVQTGWRMWGHILSGRITPSEECNFELGSSSTSFHRFSDDSVLD